MPRVASDAAKHVGQRIAATRQLAGLTQDQLAVASNVDSSNVRAYESGRAMPSIRLLVRISAALGVAAGDLLEGLTPEVFGDSVDTVQRRAG